MPTASKFHHRLSVGSVLCLLVILGPDWTLAASIDWVTVGNPGNAADSNGRGAVSYEYRIGQYEVTNGQYVEFLNAVDPAGSNSLALWYYFEDAYHGAIRRDSSAADGSKYYVLAGRDNNPVSSVHWFSAARFTNWLHNGQGSGDTETGAYTLLGGTVVPSNADTITRNAGAKVFLPNLDEWYKAAFHANDGATGNYWNYATGSDTPPTSSPPPGGENSANYWHPDTGYAVTGTNVYDPNTNYLTDVGAYGLSNSAYGTFDQAGNVREWVETAFPDELVTNVVPRGVFGGGANGNPDEITTSPVFYFDRPLFNHLSYGFRVAAIPVPEPSSLALAAIGLAFLFYRPIRARFAG